MLRIVYRVLKDGGGPEYLSRSKYHVEGKAKKHEIQAVAFGGYLYMISIYWT